MQSKYNLTDHAFLLRMRELRITSLRCLAIMLQLVTSRIIWMQYFFSPSENLGFSTTKKQSPYLSSQVVPSAKAGIFPEVRLILPSTLPVPSLNRNMLALFSLRKLSRRPTMETVQKLCPSKLESSVRSQLSWLRVRGTMALSLTGLYSFFPEQAVILAPVLIIQFAGLNSNSLKPAPSPLPSPTIQKLVISDLFCLKYMQGCL